MLDPTEKPRAPLFGRSIARSHGPSEGHVPLDYTQVLVGAAHLNQLSSHKVYGPFFLLNLRNSEIVGYSLQFLAHRKRTNKCPNQRL